MLFGETNMWDVVQSLGTVGAIFTLCVFAAGFVMIRFSWFMVTEVIKPAGMKVADSITSFFSSLTSEMKAMSASVNGMQLSMSKSGDKQDATVALQTEAVTLLTAQNEMISKWRDPPSDWKGLCQHDRAKLIADLEKKLGKDWVEIVKKQVAEQQKQEQTVP